MSDAITCLSEGGVSMYSYQKPANENVHHRKYINYVKTNRFVQSNIINVSKPKRKRL